MFQRIVLPHHQDQAVRKNEDSFKLLDPEDESAVILLDMGNHSPNNTAPYAIRLESSVTLL
jgi:hypothetical protein